MKTQVLSIDLLQIDADTQSRVAIDQETVESYAEIIGESKEWPFPPLDVFHDGSRYMVADGFHRVLGSNQAKRVSAPCRIHKGTAKDARIFGMTANDRHGLRMSRADKRSCVEWLLDNGGKMTQVEISAKAGVCRRLVQQIVAARRDEKAQNAPSGSGQPPDSSDQGKPGGVDLPPSSENGPAADGPASSAAAAPTEKCPNCAGTKWSEDDDGWACSKCSHPYGEPAGDVDEKSITDQRQKTVKTMEAALRAFDDLHGLDPRPQQHKLAISSCKNALAVAKEWK